ncbi:hypothetical protein SEA_GRASSBOY_80 [Microbacterium phage Grassboy]|nr:hypothetical protein SEA_GRASSBOY_80 [Microbacterium phage Grassboy]
MSTALTPYDRGVRGEPKVWPHVTRKDLEWMSPIELELEEDRFGKVDFDDDESNHVATIWLENAGDGYVVHIAGMDDVRIEVHGG